MGIYYWITSFSIISNIFAVDDPVNLSFFRIYSTYLALAVLK